MSISNVGLDRLRRAGAMAGQRPRCHAGRQAWGVHKGLVHGIRKGACAAALLGIRNPRASQRPLELPLIVQRRCLYVWLCVCSLYL